MSEEKQERTMVNACMIRKGIESRHFPVYGMMMIRLAPGLRLQVYTEADSDHPIHNHHFSLESTVLVGWIQETQYSMDGQKVVRQREIKQGETYHIKAETPHRIVVAVPTVTLVRELEPTTTTVMKNIYLSGHGI